MFLLWLTNVNAEFVKDKVIAMKKDLEAVFSNMQNVSTAYKSATNNGQYVFFWQGGLWVHPRFQRHEEKSPKFEFYADIDTIS